jgi:hypothetical protein
MQCTMMAGLGFECAVSAESTPPSTRAHVDIDVRRASLQLCTCVSLRYCFSMSSSRKRGTSQNHHSEGNESPTTAFRAKFHREHPSVTDPVKRTLVVLCAGAGCVESGTHPTSSLSQTSAAQTVVGPNTAGPPPCAVHGLEEKDGRYIVDVSGDSLLRDAREVFTIGAGCVMADVGWLCIRDGDGRFAAGRYCRGCAHYSC